MNRKTETTTMVNKYALHDLTGFGTSLLVAAGLNHQRAQVMAQVFLEADLMGFSTHGLNRVASNLDWLLSGQSRCEGEPQILSDRGNTFNWDAQFLPGPWVVSLAIDVAMERVAQRGLVAATIRRSQHIAALAAYCPKVVEAGYIILMSCSTPAENTVCAPTGITPLLSANPIAFAAPADDYPLLFDISMSVTAGGYVARALREGKPMPEPCLKDNQGRITDQPQAFFDEPGGSILPIGGLSHGYKGFALGIAAEVMSMALGGYGRADSESRNDGEANSVFLQIIDPAAFGSLAAFKRELGAQRQLCEDSQVAQGQEAVRFPGQRAWQRRRQQTQHGVELYPEIMVDLTRWANRLGVEAPTPIG
ncbi:MAG: LDH2 family malate/lactate/ureidoglycolate dehydrogenase [Halioglobus sp.]|jgi:LDH2 family malate/lactate/ureidoglycolate dehydrogenase